MIESRGGTRRKRSKRTNDPWHSVAWGLAVIAFVALVGGVAWFAFSRIFAPRPVEYVQNPEVPVVFALENLVEGAYGTKNENVIDPNAPSLTWERTGRGKRLTTPQGNRFEIDISPDRALITMEGKREGEPKTVVQPRSLDEFLGFTSPSPVFPDRIGHKACDDLKKFREVNFGGWSEFDKSWRTSATRSPTVFRGEMIETTATFEYDAATKNVTFRLEIKRRSG
jgi:hypothetical protein